MSRKRSRKDRSKRINEPKHMAKQKSKQIVDEKPKRNLSIPVILVGIFILVLFFNSYFNIAGGIPYNEDGDTLGTRFLLSGPDPYYNMRLCEQTIETGTYPFVSETNGMNDPLLNYPAGQKYSRPPLFNMMAVGSAHIVSNVLSMDIMDALGWCMLALPAIYGALLIIPIYGIGKELFNKKVGLIAALFVALIPVHIGSGHGSAFSLFDHDSFLLLLTTTMFLFMIKSYKEKNQKASIMYAVLSGVMLGAINLTWVAAEFNVVLILITTVAIMIFNIFKSNITLKNPITSLIIFTTAYLIFLPYGLMIGKATGFLFYGIAASFLILGMYVIIKKLKIPWIVSIPTLLALSAGGGTFIYLVSQKIIEVSGEIGSPINKVATILFGTGIYGDKISSTIGEANTFQLSQIVMSFGPTLYWLALTAFVFFIWKTHKGNWKMENLFFITLFIVYLWLLSTAGRFINDLIPFITVFAAYATWLVIHRLDYKQMIKAIQSVGGGLRGLRRGVKLQHIGGIAFVAIMVIAPNVYCTLDAAVPTFPMTQKYEIFGEDHEPAWGNNLYKSVYWSDACRWLADQDTEIENPADRPGFISWWDYGFFESSMGRHPTVADNYQSGIPPAANFQTSQSEQEAVAVLIVRLAEGEMSHNNNKLNSDTKDVLHDYLQPYNATNITVNPAEDLINILEKPLEYATSYDKLIAEEWGNTVLKETLHNAMYHDATRIITDRLDDEKITMLYKDIQETTGYSIRYYGVEGYDAFGIFGVFLFLADKSVQGHVEDIYEDDFTKAVYVDQLTGREYSIPEVINMTDMERQTKQLSFKIVNKDTYYNSMVYKTYMGLDTGGTTNSVPTYGLKHFVPVYVSPIPYPGTYLPAIVIAKYYEGAKITGTVKVGDIPFNGVAVYVMDELMGIPHDVGLVGQTGEFELIAPAGNITLRLFLGNERLEETITFNTVENPPITEEEATRDIYTNRTVEFQLDYANINGTVNINGTEITLQNIDYEYQPMSTYALDGEYNFENILPSTYKITATNETGGIVFQEETFLLPGNNTFNINIELPEETIPEEETDES